MYFVQNGGDIWNKFRNKEMMNPTLTKKYVVTKMFYFFFDKIACIVSEYEDSSFGE